jgi:hypothetical protein
VRGADVFPPSADYGGASGADLYYNGGCWRPYWQSLPQFNTNPARKQRRKRRTSNGNCGGCIGRKHKDVPACASLRRVRDPGPLCLTARHVEAILGRKCDLPRLHIRAMSGGLRSVAGRGAPSFECDVQPHHLGQSLHGLPEFAGRCDLGRIRLLLHPRRFLRIRVLRRRGGILLRPRFRGRRPRRVRVTLPLRLQQMELRPSASVGSSNATASSASSCGSSLCAASAVPLRFCEFRDNGPRTVCPSAAPSPASSSRTTRAARAPKLRDSSTCTRS